MLEWINLFFDELIHIFNEVSVYLLLGFFFAGLLHVYFPKEKIHKYLGQNNFKSVINAAILGVPLPLCSCGVIPTGVSLYKEGASKGASLSFLISTPQTGIDSILITYSLLGLPFALARTFVAFIAGIFGGFISNIFNKKENGEVEIKNIIQPKKISNDNKIKRLFKYAFIDFMQDIAKWLSIGLLIASLITVIIPHDFFTSYLNNKFFSMLLILVAAIPMYVCATGSVPIAAALMLKGLSPGAAMVFLMAGPATNSATITVISKVFGKKTTLIYLFAIILISIISGLIIDYFFASFFNSSIISHLHNHSDSQFILIIKSISSIVLFLLIVNSLYRKYFYLTKKVKNMVKIIKVKGMTCNHCKNNVEKNLIKIDGIEKVEVFLSKSEVHITGDNFNITSVINIINDLGYDFEE